MWWPKNGHTVDTAADILKELAPLKDEVRYLKDSHGKTASAQTQLEPGPQEKLKKLTKSACGAAMTTARGWVGEHPSELPIKRGEGMRREVSEFLGAVYGAWWQGADLVHDMETKMSIMESSCVPSWLEPEQREMCRMWLLSMMKNNK